MSDIVVVNKKVITKSVTARITNLQDVKDWYDAAKQVNGIGLDALVTFPEPGMIKVEETKDVTV